MLDQADAALDDLFMNGQIQVIQFHFEIGSIRRNLIDGFVQKIAF